jgi:hypothetical protein
MPQVHWKELDKDYIIDIYKEGQAYSYFDFYNVYAWDDGTFLFLSYQHKGSFTLENFKEVQRGKTERDRVDSEFSVMFRIDDSDIRFYTDEINVNEDTFEILKKAVDFCEEYWNANFK